MAPKKSSGAWVVVRKPNQKPIDLSLTRGNERSPDATPAGGTLDHDLVLVRSEVTDNGVFNVRDEHTSGIDG